jgi:hypothetical protein
MTDQPFRSTPAERRETVENDRRVASTFHQFAAAEAEEIGGRFSATAKATVIGSTADTASAYDAAPAWANDPSGPEPPLNYQIDALEPVGTEAEIQKSLDDQSAGPSAGKDGVVAGAAPPEEDALAPHPADASSQPKPRRS